MGEDTATAITMCCDTAKSYEYGTVEGGLVFSKNITSPTRDKLYRFIHVTVNFDQNERRNLTKSKIDGKTSKDTKNPNVCKYPRVK